MRDISCDIAVIGSDYVGLCCGYALRKLGLKVEFISIKDQPSSWLSPWVQLHGRPNRLDWRQILPKPSKSQSLSPLQLSCAQSRISLEPSERRHLAKWLQEVAGAGKQASDPRLLRYFELKSTPPPSRQTPTLTIPSSSGLARLLKSQRGGALSWPSGNAKQCSLDLSRYPGKALFNLAGLSETSEPPTFLEDDLESFLFGTAQEPLAGAIEESIRQELTQAIQCEGLNQLKVQSSFGSIKSIHIGSSAKIRAQTYLFNLPSSPYQSLTGETLSSDLSGPTSNLWNFTLKASNLRFSSRGRVLYTDPDESSVCYLSWTPKDKDITVDLVTTEDVGYEDIVDFSAEFFGIKPTGPHTHQQSILPTLSQLNQPRVATRYRNGLYAGEALAPRHHLAAQCDIAEELLKAVSIYREAPLNLDTLPHFN